LKAIIRDSPIIQYSQEFDDGLMLYNFMVENQLEGIVAKSIDSEYVPGERTSNWLKIPIAEQKHYVIGGWVDTKAVGRPYGTLLVGHYDNGKLYYMGNSSHGMKDKDTFQLAKNLRAMEVPSSPFANIEEIPKYDNAKHWVKPKIVASFKQKNLVTALGERRHQITIVKVEENIDPKRITGEKMKTHGKARTKTRMGKS
jgi:bifunctional non-homologous end joining protein LigD